MNKPKLLRIVLAPVSGIFLVMAVIGWSDRGATRSEGTEPQVHPRKARLTRPGDLDGGGGPARIRTILPPERDTTPFRDRLSSIQSAEDLAGFLDEVNQSVLTEPMKAMLIREAFKGQGTNGIDATRLYNLIVDRVEQRSCRKACLKLLGRRLASLGPEEAQRIVESVRYDDDLGPIAVGHFDALARAGLWKPHELIDLYSAWPGSLTELGREIGSELNSSRSGEFLEILHALDKVTDDGVKSGPNWQYLERVASSQPMLVFEQLVAAGDMARMTTDPYLFSNWASSLVHNTESEVTVVLNAVELSPQRKGGVFGYWLRNNEQKSSQWFNANVEQMPSENSMAYALEFQKAAKKRGDQDSARQWAEFIERERAR